MLIINCDTKIFNSRVEGVEYYLGLIDEGAWESTRKPSTMTPISPFEDRLKRASGLQGYLAHKKQRPLLGPPYCRVLEGGCFL